MSELVLELNSQKTATLLRLCVFAKNPAASAGILAGDVISKVNDEDV